MQKESLNDNKDTPLEKAFQKALHKVCLLLDKSEAQIWRGPLERVGRMSGACPKFKSIATAREKERLYDYLAEIRYALVFASLGFQVKLEPLGREGPDLEISRDGHIAVVEVKRFRQINPGPSKISLSDKEFLNDTFLLESWGDFGREINKCISQIRKKFKQVGHGDSIIALWNDDEDLDEIGHEEAVRRLHNYSAKQGSSPPSGLLFILYASNWYRQRHQFYCFPLRVLEKLHVDWIQEIERSFVGTLIQRALTSRSKSSG